MKTKILFFSILAVLLMSGNAFALSLGNEITIWDDVTGSGSGWYNRGTNPGEDEEVEPGCLTGQVWDLEGVFLDGTSLIMVGGYDFKDGHQGWASGDIFIDTNLDARYGRANQGSGGGGGTVADTFGYEFALDLDLENGDYTVWALDPNDTTVKVHFNQNDESNPWAYDAGGEDVGTHTLMFYEDLTGFDDVPALGGDIHYAVSLDLSDIGLGTDFSEFISHYTYECGNDNLMGKSIPDATTLVLLGSAMLGACIIGRRKKHNI